MENPQTHIFEIFNGEKKIAISVANSSAEAIKNAHRATTRNTVSKLDEAGDYGHLTARLFCYPATQMHHRVSSCVR